MKISSKGIHLIKKWETLALKSYKCSADKTTIGYGHVILPKEKKLPEFKDPITEEFAEELLLKDIEFAENAVNEYVSVPLTQGQFDALVSLVFNWGTANFSLSKGLKKLNSKDYDGAAIEFFDKEKGVVKVQGNIIKGLVNRRAVENDLWKDQRTKKKSSKRSFVFYAITIVSVITISALIFYIMS